MQDSGIIRFEPLFSSVVTFEPKTLNLEPLILGKFTDT